jgi:hypothetical protein
MPTFFPRLSSFHYCHFYFQHEIFSSAIDMKNNIFRTLISKILTLSSYLRCQLFRLYPSMYNIDRKDNFDSGVLKSRVVRMKIDFQWFSHVCRVGNRRNKCIQLNLEYFLEEENKNFYEHTDLGVWSVFSNEIVLNRQDYISWRYTIFFLISLLAA